MAIIDHLREGLSDAPSARRPVGLEFRQELAPAAGAPVQPPSYQGELEIHERHLDGATRKVIELDSVGSSANGIEEVLEIERLAGRYPLPVMTTTIDAGDHTFEISSLAAPHRATDAWLRLSTLPGSDEPFEQSPDGRALSLAHADALDPVLEMSTADLLLGVWDSHRTGPSGQLRIPRSFTSTVLGLDPLEVGTRAARRDPLNLGEAKDVKAPRGMKLSEQGLSSIPPVVRPVGVSISSARFIGFLSFAALRRLRFASYDDSEVRVLLAALCLYGVLLRAASGWFLRSGCDLLPTDDLQITMPRAGTTDAQPLTLGLDEARALLDDAVARVAIKDRGIRLVGGPRLTPLVERGLVVEV
jgi:CRISPR-associated protein Csb1